MTSPAYRASSRIDNSSVTSQTSTEPTGTVLNDIIIATVEIDFGHGTITAPSGWTLLGSASTTDADTFAYWIRRGSSAPALQWTWLSSVSYVETYLVSISGAVNTGNPIDVWTFGTPQTTGTIVTPPPVTIITTDTLSCVYGFNWINGWSSSPTAPTGYTTRLGGNFFDTVIATKAVSVTGTETPSGFSSSAGSSPNLGLTIVVASQASISNTTTVSWTGLSVQTL